MDRRHGQVTALALLLLLSACEVKLEETAVEKQANCLEPDAPFEAGFAAVDFTPENIEGYVDENGNHLYDYGEKTTDTNGNGVWEPLWIAGFNNGRAAQGVHDDLWARTVTVKQGSCIYSLTSIDSVGLLPRSVEAIRAAVLERIGAKYPLIDSDLVIAATHTHEAPDTMGYWGEAPLVPGVSQPFMDSLVAAAADAIVASFEALAPAKVRFGKGVAPGDINKDSRYPIVIDNDVVAAQFVDGAGKTMGTLVEFSMHPEVLWSRNPYITSDFPHYTRLRMEEELGGISVFAVGTIGGLMTPQHHDTFALAETTGVRIADVALEALKTAPLHETCAMHTNAENLLLPMENAAFRILVQNEVFYASDEDLIRDEDVCKVGCVYAHIKAADFCDGAAQWVNVPGELFPELADGGYDVPGSAQYLEQFPDGTDKYKGDYPDAPKEKTIRKEMMTADFKFVFGLGNGEFGYIIPKSQWDTNEYEETVSLGPKTAPLLAESVESVLAPLR